MYVTILKSFEPKRFTAIDTVKEDSAELTIHLDSFIQCRVAVKKPDSMPTDEWERVVKVDQERVERKVQICANGDRLCIEQVELADGLWLDVEAE